MDMKSKKLLLLTMNMNNSNQLKLKFTNDLIVNLEMFSSVCITIIKLNHILFRKHEPTV